LSLDLRRLLKAAETHVWWWWWCRYRFWSHYEHLRSAPG